jgi:hypothetical protein
MKKGEILDFNLIFLDWGRERRRVRLGFEARNPGPGQAQVTSSICKIP